MTEEHDSSSRHDPGGRPPEHFTQDFRHAPISARVPERVGRGVFATAVMILQTGEEFVIDFLSTMVQPQQVAARVVLTAHTFAQFLVALRANIAKYEQQFGPLVPRQPALLQGGNVATAPRAPSGQTTEARPEEPTAPSPETPSPPPPRIEELYEQLRLPDEMLGGAFANVVLMRHTPEEFCFDFIASFYPRSVVANRVYMAAGRVPSFLDALTASWQKYQQRARSGPPPQAV